MRLTGLRGGLLPILGAAMWFGGCAEPVEDIDRTQPNLLTKDLFDGEWYFARTVIDVPYEASGTFIGDRQEYHIGGEDFPAYKIRWRLEEDFLFACRVDEVIIGGNSEGRTEGDEENPSKADAREAADQGAKFPCTHPVAAFRVQHIDVIRQYNSTTGEQSNVIVENQSDRHWYERDFVRVDWTDQVLSEVDLNLFSQGVLDWAGRVRGAYYVQAEPGDCRTIDAKGNVDYRLCEEGFLPPVIEEDAFLITQRMSMEPHDGYENYGSPIYTCWRTGTIFGAGPACTNSEIGMRYSFMRVPDRSPEEAYEPVYYPDDVFERVGVWRVLKNTYTPGRGETDFKQKLGTRFKIWKQTRTCDANGACTPLPLAEREIEPIVYHLNRTFPQDLKPTAFRLAKEWNDAFNGIKPGVDLTETCNVVCGDNKPLEQCSATDTDWRMEGTCAFVLDENIRGDKFLGDLRYNFIAFIEDPGQGQPCGVGGPANDPETGELINGVAYVYGAGCFDFLETRVADMIDIECANRARDGETLPKGCRAIDENQYLRGLRTLEVMQAQGYRQGPTTPITALTGAMSEFAEMAGSEHMERIRANFTELKQFRGTLQSRRQKLREAGISRAMIPDELAREISGGLAMTAAELTDEEVAFVDPLAPPGGNGMQRLRKRLDALSSRAAEPAEYLFTDNGLWHFVRQHMDLERDELLQLLRENSFRAVTLHELGHNMGLRHNFVASFDRANYFPEYWDIKLAAAEQFTEEYGRPAPADLVPFPSSDETDEEFSERYAQWDRDRQLLRVIEESNGSRLYKYSSIMDYHAAYYGDWQGLGSYDQAAMRFLYAGLVDRVNCTGTRPEDCIDREGGAHPLYDREYVRWYAGGQLCNVDSDCPSAASGQSCRFRPESAAKFCSNWDEDEKASGRFNPRQQFCSDDRVGDQPFCNRFDEGESSEEIVRSMIDNYHRMFVFNNFRRYSANFQVSSYYGRIFSRYFSVIGDQMQSLLYKYFYEPGFLDNNGPGGFYDMMRATVVGFDFLGNVLAQPESGSYEWDEDLEVYVNLEENLIDDAVTGDEVINIPLGLGKPLYSSYEDGYFGVDRLAYAGVFYDKLAAIETLTLRDWGVDAGASDERFQLNFYDFFPGAYIDVLGAYMAGDFNDKPMYFQELPTADGGKEIRLIERTYWDGSFFDADVNLAPDAPAGRPVEPGASTLLNIYAIIYSMIDTPVYFDLSFTNSARVFEVGGQTSFDLSHIPAQDVETCTSPLTQRRFAAVQTSSIPSIAVQAIDRCNVLRAQYLELREAVAQYDEDPTVVLPDGMSRDEADLKLSRLENRLTQQEDRLSNLTHISELLGIGSL